jgi:hypothetical protein
MSKINKSVNNGNGLITVSPEDLGYSWCSPKEEPNPLPVDVDKAIFTSFNAIVKLVWDAKDDPISWWSNLDSFSEKTTEKEKLETQFSMMNQICKGTNKGALFDSNKSSKMSPVLKRRRFFVWNQFTIHEGIKPGFMWWSDMDSAKILSGILSQEIDSETVKNDRRHFGISKMPRAFLIHGQTKMLDQLTSLKIKRAK